MLPERQQRFCNCFVWLCCLEEETVTDPNLREIIIDILDEVLEQGKYSHLVLKATLDKYQYLPKNQRAFITRVTQGTIERMLQIDAVLDETLYGRLRQYVIEEL